MEENYQPTTIFEALGITPEDCGQEYLLNYEEGSQSESEDSVTVTASEPCQQSQDKVDKDVNMENLSKEKPMEPYKSTCSQNPQKIKDASQNKQNFCGLKSGFLNEAPQKQRQPIKELTPEELKINKIMKDYQITREQATEIRKTML